jgi:hypothetical protein
LVVAGWLLAALSPPGVPAAAQGSLQVRITSIDAEAFPRVTLHYSVADGSGRRVPGLPGESFVVMEDGGQRLPLQVAEERVGVRQVYILDTSRLMGVRDSLGRTRFDFVRDALLQSWRSREATLYGLDDWSLIATDGPLSIHGGGAGLAASALFHYAPSFPDIDGLGLVPAGLDLLADVPPRPGMPESIVFLTASQFESVSLSAANALSRARSEGVAVHVVWIPLPGGEPSVPEPLRQLAEETGGIWTAFDPEAGLGSTLERVLGERSQYRLTYTSQVQTSGLHEVSISVTAEERQALSAPREFRVEVLPPTVAFVGAPGEITRQTSDASLAWEDIPPTAMDLEVLVAFPDAHPRPLESSQLMVDGEVADRRTEAPFNRFRWDLSGYRESGLHTIQVIVRDSLDLQGATLPLPLRVQVVPPPRGLTSLGSALVPLAAAVGLLAAGSLLAARILAAGTAAGAADESTRGRPRPSGLRRAGLRRGTTQQPPEAWLDPADGAPTVSFPLTGMDVVIGRDPSLASLPLLDESVSGLHAQITRLAGGGYLIRDQGSRAGTWVNFEPVPAEGRTLSSGDLIHVGRVALRFRAQGAPAARAVRVTTLREPDPGPPGDSAQP